MADEKKKYKNLATYAVVMVLTVVVLILFAAMADNREQSYETQLNEKENINISIQNEIVSLRDENYELRNTNDKNKTELDKTKGELEFYKKVNNVWSLYYSGEEDKAAEAVKELLSEKLSEEQKTAANKLSETINGTEAKASNDKKGKEE